MTDQTSFPGLNFLAEPKLRRIDDSASLWGPSEVALGARGGIYIADTQNQRVRYVAINGIISTVAGNGTPEDGGSTIAERGFSGTGSRR
ncbi:MAG TPA: hypothetical protein VKU01_19115 [Bryobacteraceae bacterium]|nr:hypothetical protein [Bryobacteraceae bacterium]